MPRIPVRTTPYHTLPRCTRHYKSKRDLILRALGKASFINGSQFVIAWISPKGEVDVYASELLQAAVSVKEGGVLCRKELDQEAARVRGEMNRRWEEIRRLEESGEAPVLEDDQGDEAADVEEGEDEDVDDADPDRTFVEDTSSDSFARGLFDGMSLAKKPSPNTMMSTFPAARSSTPTPPMHTLNLAPTAIDDYYISRFAALQQATCKLVVKAWIKVIEPKKQMKFPYNKGEELRPAWWPEGVRHREPDHLSKTERLTLLASIVRSPLITVSRLELSTAEAAAFISRPRLAILREVYLVAKEEEKRRKDGDVSSDLIVHLPNLPVSPSAVSPDASEKRAHARFEMSDKEGLVDAVYGIQPQKRIKQTPRLTVLATSNHLNHDTNEYGQPFTYVPQNAWREIPPAHLSPYPHSGSELAYGSDYSRSPIPEAERNFHPNHLAPILNHSHSHSHSPIDSPAFSHSGSLQPPTSTDYFSRNGQSYMQQQQMEYLHIHGHSQAYDYGSPYLADAAWDGSFSQTTNA